MNTMIRIAFLAALLALIASCEFFKENDTLEELKKNPPTGTADTDETDNDEQADVDNIQVCGDGTVQEYEECDRSLTDKKLCTEIDPNLYSGGETLCAANCKWDLTQCISKTCGDGTVQPATEECDVAVTDGTPCNQIDPQAYNSGMATCAENCKWDLSACVSVGCGDGTVGANEDCEGDSTKPCKDIDPNKEGTATCNADTCKWDTAECTDAVKCGNNTVDTGETCDGNSIACVQIDSNQYSGGMAQCNGNCDGWIVTNCQLKSDCTCGNGTVDSASTGCGVTEACETTQTSDCEAQGYPAAGSTTVNCKTDCTGWDTSVCNQVKVAFNFDTPFILDASRLGETAYMDAHGNAIMTGTFYGTWENGEAMPPAGSTSQGYVARSVDTPTGPSLIVQENYFDNGMSPETPSAITLNFPTDDILQGGTLGVPATFYVGLAIDQVKLFAYEPDGSGFCLKYVATGGAGSFEVTEAFDTTVTDGGVLAAGTEGQYIPLVPAATQATGTALQQGYTFFRVCGGQSCGDGIINGGEQCDISGTTSFDCAKISKSYIGGTATCDQGTCQWDFSQCQAAPACGDNNIDTGEACDDGNTTPGDGCSSNCKFVDNNCTAITAGPFSAQMGTDGTNGDMAMFVAEFTPTEGSGSLPEMFFFYIDTDFIPVKSQAYPITEAVKSDYGLQAMVDYDGMNGTVGTAFAAYAGQMHFNDYDLDGNGKFTDSAWGQVDVVYFGEIDTQGKWVQNGQCRYLAQAAWDLIKYPVITDLSASYSGTVNTVQLQWTAPGNASRYNQYRICVNTTCNDVAAGMSPGGTEIQSASVLWYSGTYTVSVQPLRDGTVAATAASVDVDTNGHAELAPVSGIDFGLVGYNSYLDRAVTINNTSTLVDLIINETTLPMDCTGKVTVLSGNITPASQITVDPGAFHTVTLRYAPTEVSQCTDGQFRAQWIVTNSGGSVYDEETLPVTGSSANTPPVITGTSASVNPAKNSNGTIRLFINVMDENTILLSEFDGIQGVGDFREVGGGVRESLGNTTYGTGDNHWYWWRDIDVSTLGNGIYVIPITVTDSAGHIAKTNATFAIYSGNILEVGDGKTYTAIKDAVNAAGNYDVIVVHPGTYTGTGNSNINPGSKTISIYGIAGPDDTIIDATGMLDPTFVVDQDNGNLYIGGLALLNNPGGAVWLGAATNNQKVSLTDFRIEGNSNSINGGALTAANDKVDLTITHGVFHNNSATGAAGGAVYASAGAKMFFVDVLFDDNTAQMGGAVATNAAGPITFDRCVFTSNEGTVQGGALNFVSANGAIEMRNCIVAQNTSGGHGGGLFIDDSVSLPVTLKIYDSTIVENVATYDGGGINMIKGSFEMKDSLLFFNQAGAGLTTQLVIYDDGTAPPEVSAAVVQNCAIGGGTNPISDTGTRINAPNGFVSGQQGNIIDDPLFVGGTTGGVMRFRLSAASPCIDTGSDGSTVPTYDFLGYSRYNVAGKGDGTGIENDMGAFEYQP